MKKIFGKVLGIFSDDLGIDLGTSNTLICVKNKGIIMNAPSVVAINTKTKDIFEVGDKAKQMIGRTPHTVEAIRPLKNGVIADYEITKKMLREFYKIVNRGKSLSSPRVIICVPAGVTQVEKRAVMDVTREAGAREAYLIEEPMAAAIGIGLNIFEPEGNMVVDIGGGTTEIGVISLAGIAGDKFDSLIIDYIRQKHNLFIGEKTAEEIKIAVGAVTDLEEDIFIEISGRNALSGLPKNVKVYSSEIAEALEEAVVLIIEEIKGILEKTPPELSSDIKRKGIYLAGGGALLRGIDKRIAESLSLEVTVAEDPLNAVVNGIQQLLKEFDKYKRVLISPESDY